MPDTHALDSAIDQAEPPVSPVDAVLAAIEHYVGIKALDVAMSLQDERTDYTLAIQQARERLRRDLTAFLQKARQR